MSQLRRLQFLNLSNNKLCCEANVGALQEELSIECSSALKRLALNNTGIPLEMVFSLLEHFTGYVPYL